MKRLVIDIETVGTPWEEHDPYVREYLIKGMNEAEAEEEKRRGALSPFVGRIVAIGVLNADTRRSCVFLAVPGQEVAVTRREGSRTTITGSEKAILEKFWEFFERDDRFISFNGRQFDGPFLMIRSAIHGLVPKRDLVGYRYDFKANTDLREVLSFCGTINTRQIRFNLDLACRTFGIVSSKSDSMDGRRVESLYRAGQYEEIANYCLEDVRATAELYEKLASTILVLWNHEPVSRPDDTQEALPGSTFAEEVEQTSEELKALVNRESLSGIRVTSRNSAGILRRLIQREEEKLEEIPLDEEP